MAYEFMSRLATLPLDGGGNRAQYVLDEDGQATAHGVTFYFTRRGTLSLVELSADNPFRDPETGLIKIDGYTLTPNP